MSGIFSKPKKPDPLPPPEPPTAPGMPGEAVDTIRSRLLKSGRGGSILAGPLRPKAVGRKLLGGDR